MSRMNSRFTVSKLSQKDLSPFLFLGFFILGAVLIAIAKLYQFPVGFVVAIPVVVILGYALLSWFLPRFELRRDQIGDNLYYMGFLLTLVSLTATLIQYSHESDEDFIVSNFGLALVATIVGILGRTVLNQFRKDVVDIEKEIQFNLSKASLKLRGQMNTAVEDFATFHRHMEQVTKESARSISEAHQELAKGLAESVEEIVGSLRDQVEKSSGLMNLKSEEVINELSEATSRLIIEVDKQKDALATLAEATESASDLSALTVDTSPLRDIEKALVEFKGSFNSQITELNENSSEQAESFSSSMYRIQHVLESISKATESAIDLGSLTVDTSALREIESSLWGFKESINSQIAQFHDSSSEQAENLKKMVDRLNETFKNLNHSMNEQVISMEPSINKLTDSGTSIEKFLKNIEDLNIAAERSNS